MEGLYTSMRILFASRNQDKEATIQMGSFSALRRSEEHQDGKFFLDIVKPVL